MNCDVVVPIVKRNIDILKINIPYILTNLECKKIVIIGRYELRHEIEGKYDRCIFVDEDKLLTGMTYETISKLIEKRNLYAKNRCGWYLQQFIKMAYSYICEDEYYVSWDADTIPLKKIDMFTNNNNPIFDMRNEYNPRYFTTLKKILNIDKMIKDSFISEHMVFSTFYMKQLIFDIQQNEKFDGEMFFEKILNSIHLVDLEESGFSEFETYGNYILSKYDGVYKFRKLKSLRNGEFYLGSNPSQKVLDWAAKSFNVITIENRGIQKENIINNLDDLIPNVSLQQLVNDERKF